MAGKSSMVRELGSFVRLLLLTPGRGTAVIMKVGMWGRGALLARSMAPLPLLGEPVSLVLSATVGVEVTGLEPICYKYRKGLVRVIGVHGCCGIALALSVLCNSSPWVAGRSGSATCYSRLPFPNLHLRKQPPGVLC